MKYFLTGITGQLGVVMTKKLLDNGDQVVGMYRRTANGNFNRLEEAGLTKRQNLRMCSGDLTDFSSLDRIIIDNKPDVVINFAASSHVGESFKSPISNLQITGAGCANLLEAVRNNLSTEYKPKIVQMSSSEMFGSNFNFRGNNYSLESPTHLNQLESTPEDCYQDESTPLSANSPYAAAKIYSHNMCELYKRAYGMYINSMICFNMESEWRGINFVTRKITDYCARLYYFNQKWKDKIGLTVEMSTKDVDYIKIYNTDNNLELDRFPKLRLGNLDSMRDWMYAEDACDAILLSLEFPCSSYVVCSEEAHSIKDFCKASFSEINISNWNRFVVVDPKFFRPVEVPFLKGRSHKVRNVTGWNKKVKFEDMVKIMVEKDKSRHEK